MKTKLPDEDIADVCSFCEGAYTDQTIINGPRGNICGQCLGICLSQMYSPKSGKHIRHPRFHFDLNRFEDPGKVEIILERLAFIGNQNKDLLDNIDAYTEGIYDAVMADMNWLGKVEKPARDKNPAPNHASDIPDIVA